MNQAVTTSEEAQPDEVVIFQGDATLVESLTKAQPGRALGTTQKFVFEGKAGEIFLRKADVAKAEEQKHGLARKWVVTTRKGESYAFLAENSLGLQKTMLSLTGHLSADEAARQPALTSAKSGTAWLAAFGPTLSGLITLVLLALWNGSARLELSNWELIKAILLKLTFIYLFLRIDYASLQRQGFNTDQLGIPRPQNIFSYLFARARAFQHSKAYAYTWCVTFALELAFLIFG